MQPLWKLFCIFFQIGAFTFGGGYVMIPIIQHEISEKYQLVKEEELADMLVLAQSLPGVMAVNAATLVGYKLYGKRGAAACALAVVLPSFLIIILLANLILKYHDNRHVVGAFVYVRAVVVGMIAAAAFKMGKPCYHNRIQVLILCIAFVVTVWFAVHPVILILLGAAVGWVLSKNPTSKKQEE